MKTKLITFKEAIENYVYFSLVLLNSVDRVDPDFDPFSNVQLEEDEDGESIYPEIFQYFVTDLSDENAQRLIRLFPEMILSYSDKLEAWILCVDHYGTAWSHVHTTLVEELV